MAVINTTDIFSKQKRKWIMSRIRSKNTKIEKLLAERLKDKGIRIKFYPKIFGNPDIMVKNSNLLIFVDGCFWHKCPKHFTEPKSRRSFWLSKIENNVKRDRKVNRILKKEGFNVLRIWEHEVEKDVEKCANKVLKALHDGSGN